MFSRSKPHLATKRTNWSLRRYSSLCRRLGQCLSYDVPVVLDAAEALLDPVSDIDGFLLACLVDASTGMVLASRKDHDEISLPTAAAGAADIASVLSLLAGGVAVGGPEEGVGEFRR